MQKKSVFATLVGAALVMPLAAQAEGLYVSAGLGQTFYDSVSLDNAPLNDAEPGSGSLAFGYKLNDTWGAEVGYVQFGTAKYGGSVDTSSVSLKFKTQTVYAAVVGKLPLTSSLSGHGKLGLAVNHTQSNLVIVDGSARTSESYSMTKSSPLLGLGLAYQFTPTLSGLLDYTYVGKVTDGDMKVSMVSLGLRYHF